MCASLVLVGRNRTTCSSVFLEHGPSKQGITPDHRQKQSFKPFANVLRVVPPSHTVHKAASLCVFIF